MAVRISDRDDWFEIWFEDKQSMIEIMTSNMAADLQAGYDFFGNSIQSQMRDIQEYKNRFDAQMEDFKFMEDKAVNRWCFYDLKKRGAI